MQKYLFLLPLLLACGRPLQNTSLPENKAQPPTPTVAYVDPLKDLKLEAQLMTVIRRVFQDQSGNIWFIGDDAVCWDGDRLIDFSANPLLAKSVFRQVAEDQTGVLWFGTNDGIVRYDPKVSDPNDAFTRFQSDNLPDPMDVWSLTIDRNGMIWVGSLDGAFQFDGKAFIKFDLPPSEPDPSRGVTSAEIVHSIMEDRKGQMWFATNGGVYVYNGQGLTHLSEENGLCNNVVNDLLEDQNGDIWFASHHNGVCRWDGSAFTTFGEAEGIRGKEAWSLYEDQKGNIWFPIEHDGVYRYDGRTFTNFGKADGLKMNNVHSILEDDDSQIWMGGFGGVNRLDVESCENMPKDLFKEN
ncbi:MAG: two-component regulator propeller domain-containing protein [Bacteroidota bacterium]